MKDLGINIFNSYNIVRTIGYSKVFSWDITSSTYFWKYFLAGAFITIAMTGLDQDIMQKKSYLIKNIKEARKNILSFTTILIVINILFLFLGALLYMYADKYGISVYAGKYGIDEAGDTLYGFIG